MRASDPGLRGEKVVLRALTTRDLEALRAFVNDPEVMRASSVYAPINDRQQEAWWNTVTLGHHAVWFAIEDVRTQSPQLVGTCCLVDIDWVGRAAELRIRIGEKAVWGGGLGSDACAVLLGFGFDELNLERIGLRVWASNTRAQRLYDKLGFVVEGRLRRAAYVNGVTEDVIVMGLLRDEWRARIGL